MSPSIDRIPLRIIVETPPAGVAWHVQRGRDELWPATRGDDHALQFDLSVRVELKVTGELRWLGDFVQGPPDARFVYVNSGQRAGQLESPWDRRAKISLMTIEPDHVRRVQNDPALVLVARFAGTGRDGGPSCASVPLLGGGWSVTPGEPG